MSVDGARPISLAQRRRAVVSHAIEEAALDLFSDHSVEDVSVEQIAAAAGVSVRSFYRYFAAKELIVAALPLRFTRAIAQAMADRPASEPPFEALRASVAGLSGQSDPYLRRWQRAMARSHGDERLGQIVVGLTAPVLAEALAARAGLDPAEPWPELAGASAATALVLGARRWGVQGGSLRERLLAPLDVLAAGLADGPG